MVVLNDLPVHPKNAPLLLLATGKKQAEFCEWLLETHDEMSLQSKQRYMLYLAGYNLVKNREVLRKMWNKIDPKTDNDFFLIELMAERERDDNAEFVPGAIKRLLKTDSPIEVAQAALQADSPEEAALKLIQNEEQMARLLELALQRSLEWSKT